MIMQPDLFDARCEDKFTAWVHTPAGGEIANHFIRLAYGLYKRGFKHYGAKGICERLRWHFLLKNYKKNKTEFKINNSHVSRLARFAEDKVPELHSFFEKRKLKS